MAESNESLTTQYWGLVLDVHFRATNI